MTERNWLRDQLDNAKRDWEPVAYAYELASKRKRDGTPDGWRRYLSWGRPHVPADMIRNLQPLYADGYLRGHAHGGAP